MLTIKGKDNELMKVCYIGNSNHHMRKWVSEAVKRNFEVLWIVPCEKSKLNRLEDELGEVRKYQFNSARKFMGYVGALVSIDNIISSERPDIVHAHYLVHNGLIAMLQKGNRPLVVSAWGSDVKLLQKWHPFSLVLEPLFKRIDLLTTCGTHLKEFLVSKGYVPKQKCINLPFGVDIQKFSFSSKPFSSREYDIVSTRNHERVYDVDTLLYALSILRRNQEGRFKVVIAGRGSQTERLMNLSQRLNLTGQINFTGNVSPKRIASLLSNSKIYVSCSLSDGISTSLLEAMSCGVIPVVSDIPANRPWIKEENGMLFQNSNPLDLATKLEQVLSFGDIRLERMAKTNRESIENKGSIERTLGEMRSYYEQAVWNHKARINDTS